MISKSFVVAMLALVSAPVLAQTQVDSAQNVVPPGSVTQTAPGTVSQPTQVVNVQSATPVSTPVTVVEEAPLRESRADAIRRQRQDIETETEQKIVEKLEAERIRAERERAEKISKALEGKAATEVQSVPAQPVQQAQMEPQVVYVREPAPVVASETKAEVPDAQSIGNRLQISALGGIGDYPSLGNVKGVYSAGVTVGLEFADPFVVEGGLLFSSFDVQPVNPYNPYVNGFYYPEIKSMDQTNFFGGLKYIFLEDTIRPNIGALVGYTRRVYRDRQYYAPSPEITSNAFDAGLSTGLDIRLSKNFSAGFDLRYLFNLSYRVNGAPQTSIINPSQFNRPIEEYSYYLVTIGGRFTF